MSKPAFKYRFRAYITRGLLRLFALLPLSLNHMLGSAIGRLAYRINNDLKYSASINIQRCLPQLSQQQQQQLNKAQLIGTGKTFTEAGAMWLWSGKRILNSIKEISGEEHVEIALSKGKGVIFAMPHMGSWELVSLYCSNKYPMTTLYRPPDMQALEKIVRTGRERLGATLVPTDNRGVKALLKALNSGETIGILPDQEPGKGQGVFAPFFGIPAYSMSLLSRLVQKTSAEVVFAFAERLPFGQGYHLHFLPAPEGIRDKEMDHAISAVNLGVQRCIEQCPGQYQWGYRRFKTRPEGEGKFY
ncbi:MAG: lysophospholipid acyltransferase family protein [Gammaproteobacteria bacterium]|nr:lysophospholipid acyltransferase family protein [Gammaproteobacteria bacterium]